jgi:hypothetical protein
MPPAGFEPTIPASERPQTHVLDRAANVTGGARHESCKNGRGNTDYKYNYLFLYLIFRGPCIVIFSYNTSKSQRDALFPRFI